MLIGVPIAIVHVGTLVKAEVINQGKGDVVRLRACGFPLIVRLDRVSYVAHQQRNGIPLGFVACNNLAFLVGINI